MNFLIFILFLLFISTSVLALAIFRFTRILKKKHSLPEIKQWLRDLVELREKLSELEHKFQAFKIVQKRIHRSTNYNLKLISTRLQVVEACKMPINDIIKGINEIKRNLSNGQ